MGVFVLAGIGIWLALSAFVAWGIARQLKPIWRKALVMVCVGSLLFFAPVADELIGSYQFKRYCKEAEEVKIYGTIPVGEDFYTADGKWRLADTSLPMKERNRIQAVLDSTVRWEIGNDVRVPAVISIHYHETNVFDVKTGRLLSQHRIYGTRGGLISRMFFERAGLFVDPQCLPPLVRESQVNPTILPFNKNIGGAK